MTRLRHGTPKALCKVLRTWYLLHIISCAALCFVLVKNTETAKLSESTLAFPHKEVICPATCLEEENSPVTMMRNKCDALSLLGGVLVLVTDLPRLRL